MTQIAVPAARPKKPPYVGRHRWPEPVNPPPRDLGELEGTTRDLSSPAGLVAAARAVMGLLR